MCVELAGTATFHAVMLVDKRTATITDTVMLIILTTSSPTCTACATTWSEWVAKISQVRLLGMAAHECQRNLGRKAGSSPCAFAAALHECALASRALFDYH